MNGDGLSLVLVAALALVLGGVLACAHGAWLPLAMVCATFLACGADAVVVRWRRARRHAKSMRRWREGHLSRW